MKGRRIFDRFGFNLPKQIKNVSKTRLLKDYKEWCFLETDWAEIDGELMLSNYKPPHELILLLEKNIDKKIR
jgi:hypothetical protein